MSPVEKEKKEGRSKASRYLRILGLVGVALFSASLIALLIAVALEPLPEALKTSARPKSLRIYDRDDLLLTEITTKGERQSPVALGTLPNHVIKAILAAEDARFYEHWGADPLAMMRAFAQALRERRVVSGASTITQQLARSLFARPRTAGGKIRELIVALRIERELSKDRILEAYLNRVEFGPLLRGINAASLALLDKPASALDLSEAALLVGLPRGPSLYDPRRGTDLALRRRDRVLTRMRDRGYISDETLEQALATPIRLQPRYRASRAEHFARAVAAKKLPGGSVDDSSAFHSTLSAELQAEVEGLAQNITSQLRDVDASAAAVLVIDNSSREVLAYAGSQDFWSEEILGQNDGVLAKRQPGSTLKPFVYASAMKRLNYSPATVLPDIELSIQTAEGDYRPRNYDGRFHGPVRLRQALAMSLNVPAVVVAGRLGPEKALEELHDWGFASLTEPASHYGVALALGDGEVSLFELVQAYATLARNGNLQPLRYRKNAPTTAGKSVFSPELAEQMTDILSDTEERHGSFGRDSVLELPFPVAVKTGTSKGYRDNWTVGYTREITVGVWVGNFDGHPMKHLSGVTGAGPLFRQVMLAAMRQRTPAALVEDAPFLTTEICPLSGALRGPACPHGTHEKFLNGATPHELCRFHEQVRVAAGSGLRVSPNCSLPSELRVFETYPAEFVPWALGAKRPLAPSAFDPSCPGSVDETPGQAAIFHPKNGAVYHIDPSLPREKQKLRIRVSTSRGRLTVDEVTAPLNPGGEALWSLTPGRHELVFATGTGSPAKAVIEVVP